MDDHCDMIVFEDLVEGYFNKTLRVAAAFRYLLALRPSGLDPDYVLLMDDDTYVNLTALHSELFENGADKYSPAAFKLYGSPFDGVLVRPFREG